MTVTAADLRYDTTGRELLDITDDVEAALPPGDGLCCVFVPHATAGVAIFETGAGSEPDVLAMLERVFPKDVTYTHHHGSRGHGADHVLPVLVSPSVTVPVRGGRLELGTWQRLVLVDRNPDNPVRSLLVRVLQ